MNSLITYAKLDGNILYMVTNTQNGELMDMLLTPCKNPDNRFYKKSFKKQYGKQIIKKSFIALTTLRTQLKKG